MIFTLAVIVLVVTLAVVGLHATFAGRREEHRRLSELREFEEWERTHVHVRILDNDQSLA